MKDKIKVKFYCAECKEHLGTSFRKRNNSEKNKKETKEIIPYSQRHSFPDNWECKCDRE